jgi:hypothetical protein
MKKVKVRIIDSIAGLADPKSKAELDAKYDKFSGDLRNKDKPPSAGTIKMLIEEKKKADRYGDPSIGFPKDWSFKPKDEVMIEESLAVKWEDAGICVILDQSEASASGKKNT